MGMTKAELKQYLTMLIKEAERLRVYNFNRSPTQSSYQQGRADAYSHIKEQL